MAIVRNTGSYAEEAETVELAHHEISISDARQVEPEKHKMVIRQLIRQMIQRKDG